MAIYLKKFENHTQYENYINGSGAILPNVSICEDTPNEVHYNPYVEPTPMIDGHEYVDLGLPSGTKWATMNIGASSKTDYGNYYQYGKGTAQYAATSGASDYYGTENPLATSVDTVAQVWGGQWHMPTKAQFDELKTNTTYEWTTINGVNGGKFTAQNGNYVFFAAAGGWYNGREDAVGSGCYWSSTPSGSGRAYLLNFANGYRGVDYTTRNNGCSVRGVVG